MHGAGGLGLGPLGSILIYYTMTLSYQNIDEIMGLRWAGMTCLEISRIYSVPEIEIARLCRFVVREVRMACMTHQCRMCGNLWFNNKIEKRCPACMTDKIISTFDEEEDENDNR